MTKNLKDLVQDALQISQEFSWSAPYKNFWASFEAGTVAFDEVKQFVRELTWLKQRYVDFGSAVLHAVSFEAMAVLSNSYVAITRMEIPALEQEVADPSALILPATEALCNLLLILAESNPIGYLVVFETLTAHALKCEQIKESIQAYDFSSESKATLGRFMTLLRDTKVFEDDIATRFGAVSESESQQMMNHVYLALETVDSLFVELSSSNERWTQAELVLQ